MFQTLPGFREFYPETCFVRNHIFKLWRQSARLFGFQEYDAPILEPLELLTTKSGDEIVAQLFNFEDKGGRAITLRPEMTPSLARLVAAKANSLSKPIKWFSIGENFRYERPQKGRLRSFYQFNCDILGESSPTADAEAIALLIYSFTIFGLSSDDFIVRLSDRDLWVYFLHKCGFHDDPLIRKILSIIDKMEREKPETTLKKLEEVLGDQARSFYDQAHQLTKIHSFNDLKAFFQKESSPAIDQRLQDWSLILETLHAFNLHHFIKVDLSVVRGLAYYTGFVYEVFQLIGVGRALAGGGRYDNLVQKLGGPDTPALGWAIGDVTFLDLLQLKNLLPQYIDKPDFYVITSGHKARILALNDISHMRQLGLRVEYAFKESPFSKQLKQASQSGAHFALIYGEDEIRDNKVTIKDLQKRQEAAIPRDHFLKMIQHIHSEGQLPEDH